MSITDLESFIKQNGHLPEINSEAEVMKSGIDLGENQVKLLKKIEDLSLYIIELNNKCNDLQSQLTENNK